MKEIEILRECILHSLHKRVMPGERLYVNDSECEQLVRDGKAKFVKVPEVKTQAMTQPKRAVSRGRGRNAT